MGFNNTVTPIYFPATASEAMTRYALIRYPELHRITWGLNVKADWFLLDFTQENDARFPFFPPRLVLLSASLHASLPPEFPEKFTLQTQLYH